MKKFEYKVILQSRFNGETTQILQDSFNACGEEGWELCGIDWGCLIFKREISQ